MKKLFSLILVSLILLTSCSSKVDLSTLLDDEKGSLTQGCAAGLAQADTLEGGELVREKDYFKMSFSGTGIVFGTTVSFDLVASNLFQCAQVMNEKLGFPKSVSDRMGGTTGRDGTQEAETDNYRVTWKYSSNEVVKFVYEHK